MRRIREAVPALTAVAVLMGGCGGSSDPGTSDAARSSTTAFKPAPTVTAGRPSSGEPAREALTANASAVCRRINVRHATMRLDSPRAITRDLPSFAAYQRAAFSELRALHAPASIAHEWKQFIRATSVLVRDMTAIGHEITAGHLGRFEEIARKVDRDELRVHAIAKRNVFGDCAEVI